MSKKSLQTPQDRRSMLGFGSAAAKLKAQQKKPPEQKRLTFSANRSRLQVSGVGKRWSSQGAHVVKDTRPLSNRAYQKQMIEDILVFLNDSGYPHQISTKILSAPTTKEFLRVFEHLYSYINSNYKMDKKYEEEVPRILKSLNYPFTISKSAMFAIGSLHTWPTLLGALHWMVELIRTASSIDVEQMLFPMSFEGGNTSQQEKMFLEYFAKTYQEFMLGTDDFSEAQEILQSAIIKNAGCSEEDHQNLIDEVEVLEQELATLEAEPDQLEEAIKIKTLLDEQIEQDSMAIMERDQEHEVLKQQRLQLQGPIAEEGVACAQLGDPARQEVIKHRSTEIKVQLERLTMEKERLEQQNGEREVRFSKLYNKFYSIVNEYNDIARVLSLNPMISRYIGEQSIVLYFDHNQKDLSAFNDCNNRLKPLLVKLANQVAEDRYQLEEQKITEGEKLDLLTELCVEKQAQLIQLKTQLTNLDKELESRSGLLDKEYETAIINLREQEEYLERKLKEIKETSEEELAELNLTKATFNEKEAAQLKEKNQLANSLISFCMTIKNHQEFVEDRVKSFNDILKREIQRENEVKERIKKLVIEEQTDEKK